MAIGQLPNKMCNINSHLETCNGSHVLLSDLLNIYLSQNKRRAHNTLQRDALLYRHVDRKIAHDVANAIVGYNS